MFHAGLALLLTILALVMIAFSVIKYAAGRRSTFSHEEPLGDRVLFPNLGLCFGVNESRREADWAFEKGGQMLDGIPAVARARQAVFESDE